MSKIRKQADSRDSGTHELNAVQEQREQREEPQAETAPIASARAAEPAYQNLSLIDMDAWKDAAKGRQLRVLVAGLGGVGKSTLINQLLRLKKDEERATEGQGGEATTLAVSKHVSTTEKGMKVCLFDTPGFGDLDIDDRDVIAMMEQETEKRVDIVFYCISLSGSCRVQQADVQAVKIITRAFTSDI